MKPTTNNTINGALATILDFMEVNKLESITREHIGQVLEMRLRYEVHD